MKNPRQRNSNTSISNFVKQIDFFGEQVAFLISGNSSFKSLFGALVSTLIVIVIAIYAQKKLFDMLELGETTNLEYVEIDGLPPNEDFDYTRT